MFFSLERMFALQSNTHFSVLQLFLEPKCHPTTTFLNALPGTCTLMDRLIDEACPSLKAKGWTRCSTEGPVAQEVPSNSSNLDAVSEITNRRYPFLSHQLLPEPKQRQTEAADKSSFFFLIVLRFSRHPEVSLPH